MKSNKKLLGTGLLAAITASLCCIAPIAAIFAGTSSFASTFSFIEPFRPYLIGLTILVLAFAWYQAVNRKDDIDCDCEEDKKPSFFQSKSFLSIITVLAAVFLSFPYYSHYLIPQSQASEVINDKSNLVTLSLNVEGMTCTGCEQHITHEVNQLLGIASVEASYENGNTTVEFNKTETSEQLIIDAVNATGYTVIQSTE